MRDIVDPRGPVTASSAPHTDHHTMCSKTRQPPLSCLDPQLELAPFRPDKSIREFCVELRDRMQAAFGDNSEEWTAIHGALNEFMRGGMSKNEARRTIVQILGDHEDLHQGLDNILYHKDASWSPDDWRDSSGVVQSDNSVSPVNSDDPVNPTFSSANLTSPTFMLPQHEPQMPMPIQPFQSAPSPHQSQYSASGYLPQLSYSSDFSSPFQAQKQGYVGYGGDKYDGHSQAFQTSPYTPSTSFTWNSVAQSPDLSFSSYNASPLGLPNQMHSYQLSMPKPGPTLRSYGNVYGTVPSSATPSSFGNFHFNAHWNDTNQANNWVTEQYQQSEPSVSDHQGTMNPPQNSGHYVSSNTSPRMSDSMTPCSRQMSPAAAVEQKIDTPADSSANLKIVIEEMVPSVEESGNEKKSQDILTDSFIHALCGKSFPSRHAVKKHHWGRKLDDLATKTGCWAKNKKPDRAWDEHPSCRQPNGSRRTSAKRDVPKPQPASPKPETDSTLLPIPNPKNLVPGFPTLEQLPQTVAETVRSMPVFSDGDARTRSQSVFSPALTAAGIAQAMERDGSTKHGGPNGHNAMDERNDLDVHMTDCAHEQTAENTRGCMAESTHECNGFGKGTMSESHQIEQHGLRESNMTEHSRSGDLNTAESYQEHNIAEINHQHNGLGERSDMAQHDGITERNDSVAYADQVDVQNHGRKLTPWRLPGFKCVFDTQLPFDVNRSDAGFGVLCEQPVNDAPYGEAQPMHVDMRDAFVNRGV